MHVLITPASASVEETTNESFGREEKDTPTDTRRVDQSISFVDAFAKVLGNGLQSEDGLVTHVHVVSRARQMSQTLEKQSVGGRTRREERLT